MNFRHQLVRVGRDDRECPDPLTGCRVLPVLPYPRNPEWRTVLHGNRIGLLRPLPFDRLPLVEAVHRQNAPAQTIRVTECQQGTHGLAFGVDRLAPSCWDDGQDKNSDPVPGYPRRFRIAFAVGINTETPTLVGVWCDDAELDWRAARMPNTIHRSALISPLAALWSWSLSYGGVAEVSSLRMRNTSHSQARVFFAERSPHQKAARQGVSMWRIWYVATIGSLSALSLLPIMARPKKTEVERDGMSSRRCSGHS